MTPLLHCSHGLLCCPLLFKNDSPGGRVATPRQTKSLNVFSSARCRVTRASGGKLKPGRENWGYTRHRSLDLRRSILAIYSFSVPKGGAPDGMYICCRRGLPLSRHASAVQAPENQSGCILRAMRAICLSCPRLFPLQRASKQSPSVYLY